MNTPSDNYAPPTAQARDTREQKSRPVLGIILGLLTDISGSVLFVSAFTIAVAILKGIQGASEAELQSFFTNPMEETWFYYTTVILGLAFSVLGGFICALISRTKPYRQAIILALLVSTFGALIGSSTYTVAETIIMSTSTFLAIFLGTWLYSRRAGPDAS